MSETKLERIAPIFPSNKPFYVSDEDWAKATKMVESGSYKSPLKKSIDGLSHNFYYVDNVLYAIDNQLLGEGTYGRVFKARNQQGGLFAFKIGRIGQFEREALARLGQLKAETENCVLMTLHGGEKLNPRVAKFTELQKLVLLRDCCEGLIRIHQAHILHGDLDAHNVMVESDDKHIHAEIIDFGQSCIVSGEESINSEADSIHFCRIARELGLNKLYHRLSPPYDDLSAEEMLPLINEAIENKQESDKVNEALNRPTPQGNAFLRDFVQERLTEAPLNKKALLKKILKQHRNLGWSENSWLYQQPLQIFIDIGSIDMIQYLLDHNSLDKKKCQLMYEDATYTNTLMAAVQQVSDQDNITNNELQILKLLLSLFITWPDDDKILYLKKNNADGQTLFSLACMDMQVMQWILDTIPLDKRLSCILEGQYGLHSILSKYSPDEGIEIRQDIETIAKMLPNEQRPEFIAYCQDAQALNQRVFDLKKCLKQGCSAKLMSDIN